MPYPNEHSARVRDPGDFDPDSFRRKEVASGVSIILGKLKGSDTMTAQAYRFDKDKFTAAEAKKWLKDNDVKYISFEEATEKSTPTEGITEEVEHPAADARIQNKTLEFGNPIRIMELKNDGDDWEVAGYISIFNNVDLGHDIVRPGAFMKSLQSKRKVRFLYNHDPRSVLGVPKILKEDIKGLFGRFKISKTKLGEETHQLLQDGAIDSFSFGYHAKDFTFLDDDVRELKAIDLYEASLVSIPMNEDAIVTDFKEYLSLADQTKSIADDLTHLLNELRGITDKSRPLSEAKRKELSELLDTLSGLDAVRSDISNVLKTAQQPVGLVSSKLIAHQMAEARKRLAYILQE